jgi:tetratricopeptide (TPR) repeat protein
MTATVPQNKFDNKWLHLAVLVVAIVFAYSKIFHAGFIAWDDYEYVVHNKDITGFGAEQISAWFSKFYIGNYHPLTICSYAIDHLFSGAQPFVYHLTNILLHTGNAIILYFFINRLQPNKTVGLFVALIFALHPVQTESVSWVAERKTLLCAFFYLLALLQYTGYVSSPSVRKMVVVMVLGIASMLSKGVGAALFLSLYAVDIWMRRDIITSRKVWQEKLPLKLICVIIGIVAIKAQAAEKALGMHAEGSMFNTVMFAADAYVQYIVRLFAPVNLSVIYPYPKEVGAVEYLCLAGAIGIIALAVVAYRKKWYLLCGSIVFYTANIILVLQFIQFGECLTADRYLYIAGIGIIFPAVYYLFSLLQKIRKQFIAAIAAGAISLFLLIMTFQRNDIWLSDLDFFTSILNTFPNSSVAQYSVGALYTRMGEYDVAETHLNKAVQIDPNNYKAWYDKGALHLRQGRVDDALDALNRCIALKDYTKAYFSRALLYEGTGKPALAIADADRVLAEQPQNARAYYVKGDCLEQQNNIQSALVNYSDAIKYEDTEPLFYIRRGLALAKTSKNQQALSDLDKAVSLNTGNGEAFYYRGIVKYRSGQNPCDDLNTALKHGYKDAAAAITQFCAH